jgi:hypothetical protein
MRLAANVAETRPYAVVRLLSSVTSATYANTTLNVTANRPLMLIMAKYHIGLMRMSGMGKHVKKTVMRRKILRPNTSDKAPMRGALKNDKIPLKKNTRLKDLQF